jgi:glycosyltransferase 2 family protein
LRKTAQFLIGLILSLVAFGLALRGTHPAEVLAAFQSANYIYILPASILIIIGQMARAQSWRTLLGEDLGFARVFSVLNEGYLLNNVLPLRLGEVGRAYIISREPGLRLTKALSSVLVERLLDLMMVLLMLTGFLPLVAGVAEVRQTAVGATLIGLTAFSGLLFIARNRELVLRLTRWVLARIPRLHLERWEGRASAFVDGLGALQDVRRASIAALWSGTAWLTAGLAAWVLLFCFLPPEQATADKAFFVLVITALGIAVPSLPGGLGIFEAAVVFALSVFKVENGLAFSYGLVFHAVNYILLCILGLIALAREGETLFHLAQTVQTAVSNLARSGVPPSVE